MCLWIPNMEMTRLLWYWSPGCFWWWDKHPQHGYQTSIQMCKHQYLLISSQHRRSLPRSLLCSDTTLDQWVSRSISLHLYFWTTWCGVERDQLWQHPQNKTVDIRYHFVRENIANGVVGVRKINTKDNFSEPFTKPLVRNYFCGFTMSACWMYKVHSGFHPRKQNARIKTEKLPVPKHLYYIVHIGSIDLYVATHIFDQ